MPPKPAPPIDNMMTRHERGVKLETTVRGLLHHRALKQAHRIFDQEWERTILPHLPLRHPFELTRLDKRGIAMMIERSEGDKPLALELRQGIDPRAKNATAVVVSAGKKMEVIGFLSKDAEGVLSQAGEYADLYEPKPLQITGVLSGKLVFQMELVRPDLRQCSACDALHTADEINCEDCRKRRRRKTKSLEETAEQASVPLQSAFRHLSRETDKTTPY